MRMWSIAYLPIIDYAVSCAAPEPVWGPCWWDQSPKSTGKRTTLKPPKDWSAAALAQARTPQRTRPKPRNAWLLVAVASATA